MNAPWRRWEKAVERMIPVPKCLSTKKRILRTCIDCHVAGSVGKETGTRRRVQAQGCTEEVPYGAAVRRRSGHGPRSDGKADDAIGEKEVTVLVTVTL